MNNQTVRAVASFEVVTVHPECSRASRSRRSRRRFLAACRKKKDREAELLRAIRYERACVYEYLGNKSQARREFEKLYAEDPALEGVADRLGL